MNGYRAGMGSKEPSWLDVIMFSLYLILFAAGIAGLATGLFLSIIAFAGA